MTRGDQMSEQTDPTVAPPPQRSFFARHLVALILLVLAVIFLVENTRRVRIRVIGPEVKMPLWLALAATLVAGMLILLLAQRRRRR